MVYKRKANVLFVGSGDCSRALMAVAFAHALGEGYLSARAVALQQEPLAPEFLPVMQQLGLDMPTPSVYALNPENLAWADVVIALDEAAEHACATLPAGTQKRLYPFAAPDNVESLRQVCDLIRQRVAGMVGGMAMLASSDAISR